MKVLDHEVKLCLIMPAKNVEKYIEEAIFSYISHDSKEIILLIVEDHSEDNTFAICQRIEKLYPDIIKVVRKLKKKR